MSMLTTKQRNNLPNSSFAGPGRSYPVNDRSHAANAKARAKQQLLKGNLTEAQYKTIVSRANAVLKRGK